MSLHAVGSFDHHQIGSAEIENPIPKRAWPNIMNFAEHISLDSKFSIQQTLPNASFLDTDILVKALNGKLTEFAASTRVWFSAKCNSVLYRLFLINGSIPQGDPQYALFDAAFSGDVKMIEHLFKCVEFSPKTQGDALRAATSSNKPVAVEWLLKNGKILPETLQEEFQSVLMSMNSTIVDLFLLHGQLSPEIFQKEFVEAARSGFLDFLQRFSLLRKDLISQEILIEAFREASCAGHQRCVEFLLTLKR
jgi:hypothetical protein